MTTNQSRGKDVMNASDNTSRPLAKAKKADWDKFGTKTFIEGAKIQVDKDRRCGGSLTKEGWVDLMKFFNEKTGRNYDLMKMKYKWQNMRRDWGAWYRLFKDVTGIGWDSERNTYSATEEWWEAKIKEDPAYGLYREKGLKYAHDMTYLFKGQVATGEFAWAPSSGVVEENVEEDDVYRPTFDHPDIHNSEGSGDSEDPTIGADQPTQNIGLDTINLNTSSQATGSTRTGEKRKSIGGRGKGKVKKGKTDSVSVIGQHLQTVAAVVSSHTSAVVARKQDDQTCIKQASEILNNIPGIFDDMDFYLNCQNVLMNKEVRMWFMTCPTVEVQLAFLRKYTGNM